MYCHQVYYYNQERNIYI
uniref:Uncharacterized protein n=1 Tax=Anguilla anguilla TaxID=7936 RepID=A0A0E9XW43_ANGAN